MFHSTNVFYLDIFASLLTNIIYKMKKIMSIFSVVLFAFALTLSSCGETNNNSKKEKVECKADCAKACCLGCKATDGDAKCKEDHSCCASVNNEDIEYTEDEIAERDHRHDH